MTTTLEPSPSEIAGLLVAMTELEWPTTEEQRLTFFRRLGLRDGGSPKPGDEGLETEHWMITTALPAVEGTADTFRGEFLGLFLHAYDEPHADGSLATAGYASLHDLLSQRLGPPVKEWGTTREPACLWRPGALELEMTCRQRPQSWIQVGPIHAARSAALDELAASMTSVVDINTGAPTYRISRDWIVDVNTGTPAYRISGHRVVDINTGIPVYRIRNNRLVEINSGTPAYRIRAA